jgi:hypothetical protein
MPTYSLDLKLTKEELKYLPPGTNLVIAKPAEGNAPIIAWQAFSPFEGNTVEWEEQYGIYASNQSIENGAVLTKISQTEFPALEDKLYEFEKDAAFSGPQAEKEAVPGSFYAVNHYPKLPTLTFGLCQDATVNGEPVPGNAISAASAPLQSKISMTPHTTVYIWVESNTVSNTVVSKVTSPQTKVTFGAGKFEATLAYDSASGTFVPPAGADVSAEAIAPTVF